MAAHCLLWPLLSVDIPIPLSTSTRSSWARILNCLNYSTRFLWKSSGRNGGIARTLGHSNLSAKHMSSHEPDLLPISVRVYPEPTETDENPRSRKSWTLPNAMLVFDTETRIDATQRLTFGSYRF